ncbi:hypothetical protein SBBP2_1480015 [Burkholderiales bacterium]|nr:hypothetical protein SBBP2_1480015 [Burkholderiales bacterium]
MPDPTAGRAAIAHPHRSLLERLTAFIFREPENREQLLELLSDAHARNLLDADALSMIEGVLQNRAFAFSRNRGQSRPCHRDPAGEGSAALLHGA